MDSATIIYAVSGTTAAIVIAMVSFCVCYLKTLRHQHQEPAGKSSVTKLKKKRSAAVAGSTELDPPTAATIVRPVAMGSGNLVGPKSDGASGYAVASSTAALASSNANLTLVHNQQQHQQQQQQQSSRPTPEGTAVRQQRYQTTDNSFDTRTSASNHTQTLVTKGKTLAMPGFLQMTQDVDFKMVELFAEGGGGSLYLGELLTRYGIDRAGGEVTCAVKTIKQNSFNSAQDCMLSFQQEVSIMWLVNKSDHIAKIFGYCTSPLAIVMKYYQLGTLYDLIHRKSQIIPDDQWTPRFVMSIAYDIADGMQHLHDEGIVHSDVKPANIFLEWSTNTINSRLCAVLGDLGVASIIDSSLLKVKEYKESRVKGASLPYAAPEVLQSFVESTPELEQFLATPMTAKAGDVFSYGVVVYECLTRKFAWHGVNEDVAQLVLSGKRPKFSSGIISRRNKDAFLDRICKVIQRSWAQDASDRPMFVDILSMFKNISTDASPRTTEQSYSTQDSTNGLIKPPTHLSQLHE